MIKVLIERYGIKKGLFSTVHAYTNTQSLTEQAMRNRRDPGLQPNPTSGTMVVVKEGETRDPGWSIEEAIRAVIAGGIIGLTEIK